MTENPYEIFQPSKEFILTLLQEQKELVEEWVKIPVLLDDNRYKLEHPKEYPLFKPTKTFLREVIKELKHEAYAILNAKNSDNGFFWLLNEERHRQIIRRIRDYEFRLRNDKTSSVTSYEKQQQNLRRAKETPIQDFYRGTLRRSGKTLCGRCELPGHQDKTGSFVIYVEENRWHCFGACCTGGDVLDYIMKQQNLKLPEAIKYLLKI